MSSLAATQADGMYIPNEYLESGAYKKKSLNQFNKSKGHNQFLQRNVCRFELPFDGFCTGCNEIVGKGTRFNAHKAHVDDYFTTKIYEFTTRCRKCGEVEFKIRTNPKERTFDYVSGIRKKVEEFDSAEAGTHGVIDTELGNGILQYKNGKISGDDNQTTSVSTSLNLLERNVAGHRKVQTEHEHMESLLELNSWKDEDADANAAVRASFRTDRKAKKRRLKDASSLGLGRGIELKGITTDDTNAAKYTMDMHKRHKSSGNAHQSETDKFGSVRSGSIFSQQKKKKSSRRKSSRKKVASSPHTVDNNKKESNDDNEKKSAPQKRKIIIHNKQITSVRASTKKQEEEESSPDGGALTALSNLYASDSD